MVRNPGVGGGWGSPGRDSPGLQWLDFYVGVGSSSPLISCDWVAPCGAPEVIPLSIVPSIIPCRPQRPAAGPSQRRASATSRPLNPNTPRLSCLCGKTVQEIKVSLEWKARTQFELVFDNVSKHGRVREEKEQLNIMTRLEPSWFPAVWWW